MSGTNSTVTLSRCPVGITHFFPQSVIASFLLVTAQGLARTVPSQRVHFPREETEVGRGGGTCLGFLNCWGRLRLEVRPSNYLTLMSSAWKHWSHPQLPPSSFSLVFSLLSHSLLSSTQLPTGQVAVKEMTSLFLHWGVCGRQ